MPTLYVHVGMPKTGTTAVQYFMAKNRDVLKQHGAAYPDFGLHYEWVNATRNGHWLAKAHYSEETAKACFEMVNKLADTYPKIILSDEGLWNSRGSHPSFWKMLRENLRDDMEIKMIACIRRQDLYTYSYWAEQVKAQQKIDFKTYTFREYLDTGKYEMNFLDYRKYFERVLPVLGKENILIRVFERDKFIGGSVYADFMNAVGLTFDESYMIPEDLSNASIKGSVLEAKRLLNYIPEFSEPGNRVLKYLFAAQNDLDREGNLSLRDDFPKEERLAFLEKYRESNEWVARNILGLEDGQMFTDTFPEDTGDALPYTMEEMTQVYGSMMLHMLHDIQHVKEVNKEVRENNRILTEKLNHVRPVYRILRGIRRRFSRRGKEPDIEELMRADITAQAETAADMQPASASAAERTTDTGTGAAAKAGQEETPA